MTTIAVLKAELTQNWDVDFDDEAKTIWTNAHQHVDGYASVHALTVEDHAFDGAFRVYRSFPLGGGVGTSVDLDVSAEQLASNDRTTFVFDSGERGDVSDWKTAIRDEVCGDIVLAWFNDDAPYFSFVGRTVKVGSAERVVCGQCERTDAGIAVRIEFDRPLVDVMRLAQKVKTPTF
jgi:hypothetical protein